MKVLLLRPPAVSYRRLPGQLKSEPLGLLYLAAWLRQHSFEVSVIDGFVNGSDFSDGDFQGNGIPFAELRERVREYAPDIVGISYMYTQYSRGVYEAARMVKEVSSGILVVCGGAGAVSYEGTIRSPYIDIVVQGEGEETLLEIVRRRAAGQPLQDIPGTVVKEEGSVRVNPPRPFISPLDSLPFPARDMLDMSPYQQERYLTARNMRNPRMSIVASRGCPYRCVYCTIHCLWKHTYRMRSPARVGDEIEELYRRYGMRELAFYDDNLTFNREFIHGICDEIIRRKLDIRWSTPNGVAIWTLDKETVRKMRRAGCYKIVFGLESGSPRTLKFMHKDFMDPVHAKEIIRYCNRLGMWTMSPFLIGFPHETEEDFRLSLEFALDSGLDKATFYTATPYPGSELFDIYKREGLLKDLPEPLDEQWIGDIGEATVATPHFTREQLSTAKHALNWRFLQRRLPSFFNPWRMFPKLRTWEEARFFFLMFWIYLPDIHNVISVTLRRLFRRP